MTDEWVRTEDWPSNKKSGRRRPFGLFCFWWSHRLLTWRTCRQASENGPLPPDESLRTYYIVIAIGVLTLSLVLGPTEFSLVAWAWPYRDKRWPQIFRLLAFAMLKNHLLSWCFSRAAFCLIKDHIRKKLHKKEEKNFKQWWWEAVYVNGFDLEIQLFAPLNNSDRCPQTEGYAGGMSMEKMVAIQKILAWRE